MNPTGSVFTIVERDSESSEDTLYDGQLILSDNMTVDTVTTVPTSATAARSATSATSVTSATSATSVTSATSPTSATSKNSYAREHAKYMKKRLLDASILAKVKVRYNRYLLEKQILDIKIKESNEYIAESENAIRERNSILHPPTQPSPPPIDTDYIGTIDSYIDQKPVIDYSSLY